VLECEVWYQLKVFCFWIGHPAIYWPDYAAFSVDAMRPYFLILRIAGIFSETLAAVVCEERRQNSAYRGS
jgi:hypothetical protein